MSIKKHDPQILIADAVEKFGNQSALARELGVERALITLWKNTYHFEYVPAVHAYRLKARYPSEF